MKSDWVTGFSGGKDQIFIQARVRPLGIKEKTGSFHGTDDGLLLLRESIHRSLLFAGLLGLPCFYFHLQVIGLCQLVDLRMGFFIRVIPIDTKVLLICQIVYGSTVIGKAIRFHGAVHILLGGLFCFSQSMVVASLVKAVLKMVVDDNLITGSRALCILYLFLCVDGLIHDRRILYPESFWRRVQFFQKILRNGLPMRVMGAP